MGRKRNKCKTCTMGPKPDPSSDYCDSCRHDPDTGWGGYTDHSTGEYHSATGEVSYDEDDDMDEFLNIRL